MDNGWHHISHYPDWWLKREVRNNTLRSGAAASELARRSAMDNPGHNKAVASALRGKLA